MAISIQRLVLCPVAGGVKNQGLFANQPEPNNEFLSLKKQVGDVGKAEAIAECAKGHH